MKYIVSQDQVLLDALSALSPESSKTTLRSWLRDGRITVNRKVEKIASKPVHKGQVIELGSKQKILDQGIRILYEDDDFVIIDKPYGILSVSTAFEKGNTLHALLKKKYFPRKVFVVHRLDQDTSGVMVFALNEKAKEKLKKIFELHEIERAYTAIVEGIMEEESGVWKSYLVEDGNYYVHETPDAEKGQLAITHYEVKAVSKRNSWLNLKLETGKKNQIRVHCKSAGFPIAGDKKYGAATNPIKRLCLHAHYLSFMHPMTKKMMCFESDVPDAFFRILKPYA